MAFNFNWSPLTADAGFYTRAQELLTTALNKSPKPPIIVGDITVTELNLGSVPPELEILEVGDLAEDRFRGIFKMSYSGDAYLTLKTCVQANPLNTYILTRPAFTSPTPLAADHGLTISLQITLSEIKLSGFVVLVFSKQKGITLVFRNDPLESLKVSSTFDSIPFVRDYLQREIEGELRTLFMDELPVIIHQLSLRLCTPEYRNTISKQSNDKAAADGPREDPLLSQPEDPVDALGNVLNLSQITSLSLDSGIEMHSLFSEKNLLRLAALTDSQRTLSLFTPSINDVVFRALTGCAETNEYHPGHISPATPSLSRTNSHASSLYSLQDTPHTFSSNGRLSANSSTTGVGLGTNGGYFTRNRPSKKLKRRVVDLRKSRKSNQEGSKDEDTRPSDAQTLSPPSIPEEADDEIVTPSASPHGTIRASKRPQLSALQDQRSPKGVQNILQTSRAFEKSKDSPSLGSSSLATKQHTPVPEKYLQGLEKDHGNSVPEQGIPSSVLPLVSSTQDRSILEQAVMMKLAHEISRQLQTGRSSDLDNGFYYDRQNREFSPPPAYGQ